MDIVCSIDNNYVQHCAVMLTSLFENNRSGSHSIHLLTEGLTSENQKLIEDLVLSYNGRFFYYLIDSEALKSCPIKATDHLTIATYYRLLMADILPKSLDRILYLDCDIIINHSIEKLWKTPMSNYALAAVEEMGCSVPDVYERLQYDSCYGYFNAGVLLVNLKWWREHNLTAVFFDYIEKNFTRLVAHDQDVLNALLHDKCLHLSFEWNVEEAFYHYSFIKRFWTTKGARKILCNPSIIHYTWKPKPWEASCLHPYRYDYFFYLKKVKWSKNVKCQSLLQNIISLKDKYLFCLLLTLGIKGHHFYRL